MEFTWANPYSSIRLPVFGRNLVSTSQPMAAQAGLYILQKGGNAIDAAIAAAAVLMVVEPVSNGLGSDCFAIVWDGKTLQGLNASGVAPSVWSPEYFSKRYGHDAHGFANRPMRGWDTVTVPGALAGWQALHERFGSMPLDTLLEPAIRAAHDGYLLPLVVAKKWASAIPDLYEQPGFAQAFMPNGHAPKTGEVFRFSGAARTLEKIARDGIRDFYEGEICQAITDFSAACGGSMRINDLASYRPQWTDTISQEVRALDGQRYAVHEMPPNGQGVGALMALGILQHFDLNQFEVDGADSQHLQIEAMKLAFADIYQYVADPSTMDVSAEDMLHPDYLADRARQIDMRRAKQYTHGMPSVGGTVYLTTADQHGCMVSFIQSNYMGFGSGVVVPGWGISLQNRGYGFSTNPKSPNVVSGGKRPFHTIIPAFLMREEAGRWQPQMSFGVMGGDMQPQGHVQTIVRMLCYGQQPQAACDAPRWKVNRDFSIDTEAGMQAKTLHELISRGHVQRTIQDPYMDFGAGQFIWRLSEDSADIRYVAASDPRRDGLVAAF
ncbi:MAG: gamma-glutamyltransferase family protein [Burkholderiaceae bacterium]|jgi:gamma-glutamyltranspeptidase/glutathione hydrolase